jgi:hypothetical protein
MRWFWIGLLIIGSVTGAAMRADAATTYKFEGLCYSQSPDLRNCSLEGQLELTFEGTKVSGRILLVRARHDPIFQRNYVDIPITGSNSTEGVIELTFHFDKPETATFKKTLDEETLTWARTGDEHTKFWRPRSGEFSQAALALQRSERDCGPLYGSLQVTFGENTSKGRLSRFISGNRDLAALPVTMDVSLSSRDQPSPRPRRLPLGMALQEMLQRALQRGGFAERTFEFDIPVGTEVTVATALRRSGFMAVNLASVCNEGNEAYFVLDRSSIFDGNTFLKDKLVALLDQGLKAFAGKDRNGRAWDYTVGDGTVSTLKMAPLTSSYRVKMRVASELSRQVDGHWDSFDVLFEPVELIVNTRSEYSMVVTVENLRPTDRSTGQAPTFKNFDVGLATAQIEALLLTFLSQQVKDGWCDFTAWSADDTKAQCDNRGQRRLRAWQSQ